MKGYLYKRGDVFYLRQCISGKRVTTSLGVTTRPEAERERKKRLTDSRLVSTAGSCPSLDDAWQIFSDSVRRHQCSESTLGGYEHQWDAFAQSVGKGLGLDAVQNNSVSEYLGTLGKRVGPNTWNKHLGCLRYVWSVVTMETGLSLPDPFEGIPMRDVPLVRHEAFSLDQVRALYAAAEGEMKDIVAVAAHTGLRRIDCLMLSAASVRLNERLIVLTPEKTKRTGLQAIIGISETILPILKGRCGMVFPEAAGLMGSCPQTWGARFQRFMANTLRLNGEAGLYGFHSFRHFFSTQLTEAGVSDRLINAMMCHAQGGVQARYVHPSAEVLNEAVSHLPGVISS